MTKHILPLATAVLMLSLAACQGKKTEADTPVADSTEIAAESAAMPDSTLYGTSDEFGMSTFTLITDTTTEQPSDTLYVSRTAKDGTDGRIVGSLAEGQRYAMTTRDNNEAIGVLINLTQLEKHVKDFEITNGHIVIEGDTVEVELLNDKAFVAKGRQGKEYRF